MQSTLTKLCGSSKITNQNWPSVGGLEGAEVLVELGLTGRQARVYLALLKVGEAKAKAIADLSLVNRQEIYRVLEGLQQIGLVQRNVCVPTTFLATPIVDTVEVLLAHKTAQLNAMRQKTKQLTKKLQNNTHTPATLVEKPCLGTVFEGDRGKKYQHATQTAQHSIDIVSSWKRFKQLTTLLEISLQNALQKGVTMHIITEKSPNQQLPDWVRNAQTLTKKDCLKLKTLTSPPTATITIFDQTTAAIAFHPNTNLPQGPDLWTTNPTLVALSQTYFDNIWTQTK